MVTLCSNCLRNDIRLSSTSHVTADWKKLVENEDPITKALANLQIKIKMLDNQRNEATIKLNTVSKMKEMFTHDIPDEHKSNQQLEDYFKKRTNSFDYSVEKDVAVKALKMAEEKCKNLEDQLSAMKRLFLRQSEVINEDKLADSCSKFEKVSKHRNLDDLRTEENESIETLFNIQCMKKDLKDEANISKENITENAYFLHRDIGNAESTPKVIKKCFKTIKNSKQKQNISYPFILGCSTTASHNLAVKKQINKKFKTRNITALGNKIFASRDIKDSIANLRTIYLSLCNEYDKLLDKKSKIINSMHQSTEKNGNNPNKLARITELLTLKKEQILKIRLMVKNLTRNLDDTCDPNIYSNLSWNNY